MTKVTVIGCGNLGGAVVKGLDRAGGYTVVASDPDPEARASVEKYVDDTVEHAANAVRDSGVVILAVKPRHVEAVLQEIDLEPDQILVSFAAAVPLEFLRNRTEARVVRVMPNLAVEHQEMAAAAAPAGDSPEVVRDMLSDLGRFAEIDEDEMDVATAVNGSGPAFVFYAMKAMRDSGVEGGLSEEDAETLVAQTFKGAAEIAAEADRSLDELIDAVCSPGGTTIEGMKVLRDSEAEEAIADAVTAAEERSEEISRDFMEDG